MGIEIQPEIIQFVNRMNHFFYPLPFLPILSTVLVLLSFFADQGVSSPSKDLVWMTLILFPGYKIARSRVGLVVQGSGLILVLVQELGSGI